MCAWLTGVDRDGGSNELFRFSTTTMQWEQLDAPQVSGSPPSSRHDHGMVAVGSDLYVFGGDIGGGDTRRCAACIRLAACQIERRRCSAHGCAACGHMLCSSGMPCRAAHGMTSSLVTLDGTSPLSRHRESQRGRR